VLPLGANAEDDPKLFVFGDSLSDTGNGGAAREIAVRLPGQALPLMPSYNLFGFCHPLDGLCIDDDDVFEGDLFYERNRVSDGPVAVEILAKHLDTYKPTPSYFFLPLTLPPPLLPIEIVARPEDFGTNYAVAGATAREDPDPNVVEIPGIPPIELENDLSAQLKGFAIDYPARAPEDALYVIIIGGNDVIDAVGEFAANGYGAATTVIMEAVAAIAGSIETMISGAPILPDDQFFPGGIQKEAQEADPPIPPIFAYAVGTHFTRMFNRLLAERLHLIRQNHDDVQIKEFDLFRTFRGIRVLAHFLGFNTVDGCFDSELYDDTGVRKFHPECDEGGSPDFDRFVFFDDLHPTGVIHSAIGHAMAKAVD
jgi:hypothetical protein